MDSLAKLRIEPLGVWSTPWQADSLLGALAVMWERSFGVDALKRDFLEPWLAGEPRFVISDAFPGDWLPAPASLPLPFWGWAPEDRKKVKKRRWLSESEFGAMQAGRKPALGDGGSAEPSPIRDGARMRNSVSRATGSANEVGGLFEVTYSHLADPRDGLTLYARAADAGSLDILTQALEMLGRVGYGARASTGHGGFELDGAPMPCPELDDVSGADGFVSLSTFQPAANDPTDGYWRSFVKYGKLAPEFHRGDDRATFKRPQVMLEAGACFRSEGAPKPFYGGAISAERLLSDSDRAALDAQGARPVQAAFALAVPMVWREEGG